LNESNRACEEQQSEQHNDQQPESQRKADNHIHKLVALTWLASC
jgi:hypothetical protein